jgi:hypothetical protein
MSGRCGVRLTTYARIQSSALATVSLLFFVWALRNSIKYSFLDYGLYCYPVPFVGGVLGVFASFDVNSGSAGPRRLLWSALLLCTVGALICAGTFIYTAIQFKATDSQATTVYYAISIAAWALLAMPFALPYPFWQALHAHRETKEPLLNSAPLLDEYDSAGQDVDGCR